MQRILVTGAAGFIGSHVVDQLVEAGYEVMGFDALDPQVHHGEPAYLNNNCEYVWGDIRNRELMAHLLRGVDAVSHQAAAVGVGQSMYEVEHYTDVNTRGTAVLLDLLTTDAIDIEKLIVASSMSIYGEGAYYCPQCEERIYPGNRNRDQLEDRNWQHQCPKCNGELSPRATNEQKPLRPTSIYAQTKRHQEEMSLLIGRTYDIPTLALRYFNVYGSRQSLDNPYTGVCAIFSSRIKNGNPPIIYEDGRQKRDFVHVSDIARANILALQAEDVAPQAVNIGTGDAITVRDIAERLLAEYGECGDVTPRFPGQYRQGDIRHCYADISRAQDVLGYAPETDFQDGMRGLVEWADKVDATDHFDEAQQELEDKGLVGGEA